MTTPPTLTAGAPLPVLVDALARSAWGVLGVRSAQGARAVIRGLAALLPQRSAVGLVTVAQIADASGRSVRRTRQVLQALEAARMITWRRGDILSGGRRPSMIRVSKRLLALLVNHARRAMPRRLEARAAQFLRRLEAHNNRRNTRDTAASNTDDKRLNAPSHGEINAPLLPLRGRGEGAALQQPPSPPLTTEQDQDRMLIIKTQETRGISRRLIINPDECEICHCTRSACTSSSRRDHEFEPRTARDGLEPPHWLMLPRIHEAEAHHHRTTRSTRTKPQQAVIIPISQRAML